ncbi:MAG: hypothetical protein FADNKDHG_01552 [Holosporales bacterium]
MGKFSWHLTLISLFFGVSDVLALDADFKTKIDQSLKLAKDKGLSLITDKKCPQGCAKKQGNNLKDFIGESAAHALDESDMKQVNHHDRIIFISKSMPEESLKEMAYYAKRNNVRLVIQGMIDGSMLKTADFVEKLGYPIDIYPPLFQKYEIRKVPVFMERTDHKIVMLKGNVKPTFAFKRIKEGDKNVD